MNDIKTKILEWVFSQEKPMDASLEIPDSICNLVREQLIFNGIREVPFPFEASLSITSDTDRGCHKHYNGYINQLVKDYGLDFGDSVWLNSNPDSRFAGNGFLSSDLRLILNNKKKVYEEDDYSMSFEKLFIEYEKGNIDHWHSFTIRGPRVLLVKDISISDDTIVCTPPLTPRSNNAYLCPRDFYVVGLIILTEGKNPPKYVKVITKNNELQSYKMYLDEDKETYKFLLEHPLGLNFYLYSIKYSMHDSFGPVLSDYIEKIILGKKINFPSISRIYMININTKLIFDRLLQLEKKYGISMPLITGHAQWHFNSTQQEESCIENNLREYPDEKFSYYNIHWGLDEWFSTMADDDKSFARCMPELQQQFKIKYYRLSGWKNRNNTHLSLLTPLKTRNRGLILELNCTKGELQADDPTLPENYPLRKTTAHSFSSRLNSILNAFKPLEAKSFYTHLGNLAPTDEMKIPYFSNSAPIMQLRNQHYGIKCDQQIRIWFTRASIQCNYCYALINLCELIKREEDDCIRISKGTGLFEEIFPDTPEELYGLTFYVSNKNKAKVLLENEIIEEIVRNPADETGRESVSIAASGIRNYIIKEGKLSDIVSFFRTVRTTYQSFDSNFVLHLKTSIFEKFNQIFNISRFPRIIFYIDREFQAEGAQHMVLKLTISQFRFAILLETEGKGRFLFGDDYFIKKVKNISAYYVFDTISNFPTTYVIPFYNLTWLNFNETLPNHKVKKFLLF